MRCSPTVSKAPETVGNTATLNRPRWEASTAANLAFRVVPIQSRCADRSHHWSVQPFRRRRLGSMPAWRWFPRRRDKRQNRVAPPSSRRYPQQLTGTLLTQPATREIFQHPGTLHFTIRQPKLPNHARPTQKGTLLSGWKETLLTWAYRWCRLQPDTPVHRLRYPGRVPVGMNPDLRKHGTPQVVLQTSRR